MELGLPGRRGPANVSKLRPSPSPLGITRSSRRFQAGEALGRGAQPSAKAVTGPWPTIRQRSGLKIKPARRSACSADAPMETQISFFAISFLPSNREPRSVPACAAEPGSAEICVSLGPGPTKRGTVLRSPGRFHPKEFAIAGTLRSPLRAASEPTQSSCSWAGSCRPPFLFFTLALRKDGRMLECPDRSP